MHTDKSWDWEHEFTISPEELSQPCCDYIFKYIIGYSSGAIIDRQIQFRVDGNPHKAVARYKFR